MVPHTDADVVDVYWVLLGMGLGSRHHGEGPRHMEIKKEKFSQERNNTCKT